MTGAVIARGGAGAVDIILGAGAALHWGNWAQITRSKEFYFAQQTVRSPVS